MGDDLKGALNSALNTLLTREFVVDNVRHSTVADLVDTVINVGHDDHAEGTDNAEDQGAEDQVQE